MIGKPPVTPRFWTGYLNALGPSLAVWFVVLWLVFR